MNNIKINMAAMISPNVFCAEEETICVLQCLKAGFPFRILVYTFHSSK